MNPQERKMVQLLADLKKNHNVVGVKAEFEAEGTRLDEAMRLKDVSAAAGLGLTIKIGGCEAVKDMLDAISLGAQRIVAPMIETPYALHKFIKAARTVYKNMLDHVDLLINIETITACENFDKFLQLPEIEFLKGIVIGRVDMVGSLGMSRDAINSRDVLDISLNVAAKAKQFGLEVVVGGGVSVDSIPFFRAFPETHLDRFETRKIIFGCPEALDNKEDAFLKAVEFELMWLKNKKAHYGAIADEDNERIAMMEARYKKAIDKVLS
jgi:4-hydroxy-2-oxoheptanedioate aldolase